MEKRLNNKIAEYTSEFKDNIKQKMSELGISGFEQTDMLMQYISDYSRLILTKDDFKKRKRVKNVVPFLERCCAKRATNEQCTRRKKTGCEYCGTHEKGTPHGIVTSETQLETNTDTKTVEVWAQDIHGIIYYIDKSSNVYKAEDVVGNKINPQIIGVYELKSGVYSIPALNI
jgi:hypothetical protein